MTALPAADTVGRVIERMERHQIAVYLLSMALGAVIGFSAPAPARFSSTRSTQPSAHCCT